MERKISNKLLYWKNSKNRKPLILYGARQVALDYYRKYLVIGGMPAVVNEYVEKKDYNFVPSTQKTILNAYVADMAKYAMSNETTKIIAAFASIPAQLAKENKKFQLEYPLRTLVLKTI